VGEIEEAAACLYQLTQRPEWANEPIVSKLKHELLAQYGSARLESALEDLMTPSAEHHLPPELAAKVFGHAV
jgi:hypothetical protein